MYARRKAQLCKSGAHSIGGGRGKQVLARLMSERVQLPPTAQLAVQQLHGHKIAFAAHHAKNVAQLRRGCGGKNAAHAGARPAVPRVSRPLQLLRGRLPRLA